MHNSFRITTKQQILLDEPVVFIIDDDKEILKALSWLLKTVKINVKCYESATKFCEEFNPEQCGCIVTDVRMPTMSGLQLFDCLFKLKNSMPIIFLTGHGDIPMAVKMIKEGAVDFISKPFNEQYLLEQIQKAIDLSLQRKKVSDDKKKFDLNILTKREKQVVELIIKGNINKQIANQLHISNSTVEFHRSKAMKKLGAKNLADLINNYLKTIKTN